MLIFLTGFIASVAHVVTGPDHLAAVTPLAIDSRHKSWSIGLFWGLGHTTGMLLIGLVLILFKDLVPLEFITRHSDLMIGFLLILVGLWAIMKIWVRHRHTHRPHPHIHDNPRIYSHIHSHSHENSGSHNHEHSGNNRQNSASALFIGVFHGFAGCSHLIALLPSLAMKSLADTVVYITAFASGTILTMIVFAFLLGYVAFKSFVSRKEKFLRILTLGGGILAISIGILWLIHPF